MNRFHLRDIIDALDNLEEILPEIKEVLSWDKTEELEEEIADKEDEIEELEKENKTFKESYGKFETLFSNLELSLESLTNFLNEFLKISKLENSWKFDDKLFQVNKDFKELLEVFDNLEIPE